MNTLQRIRSAYTLVVISAVVVRLSGLADADTLGGAGGASGTGTLQSVVCTQSDDLRVWDERIENVLFRAPKGTIALPVQSWTETVRKSAVLDGSKVEMIQVKIVRSESGSGDTIGWVPAQYIVPANQCSTLAPQAAAAPSPSPSPRAADFLFPTVERPTRSYREGVRRFGAVRSGGDRIHAACDLYREDSEAVVSIGEGTVIRGPYEFYEGTWALEVKYGNGYVVRYGEIRGRKAQGVAEKAHVSRGQTVGYVGTVNSGCCEPMLHFELYKGTAKGPLSQPDRQGFQRRSDLMNPTEPLSRWECGQFGSCY